MKFPEASAEFVAKVHDKIMEINPLSSTEWFDVEAVMEALRMVMEEQKQKENRCTCERCTGIPCESLYEDDFGGFAEFVKNQEDLNPDFQKTVDRMFEEMIKSNPFALDK
jgi:hypothetical protein